MLIDGTHIDSLNSLFHLIRVRNTIPGQDGGEKAEQILAYLEVMDALIRHASKKRRLVFLDSAAGNCYLSFLAYYYYRILKGRDVEIHCIDSNGRLMDRVRSVASNLGFDGMRFYTGDILDLPELGAVDLAYSLHACDTATDKALYAGIRSNAKNILSVSCCQHSVKKALRNDVVKGITRYRALKERLTYIVADAMRAHLLAEYGYEVDVFEFTSTRNTDKNMMIRAKRRGHPENRDIPAEYESLRRGFGIEPLLARLLERTDSCRSRSSGNPEPEAEDRCPV